MAGDLLFSEILDKLKEINTEFPDLRFTQVIQNAIDESKRANNINLNDRSSKEMLQALKDYHINIQKLKSRVQI